MITGLQLRTTSVVAWEFDPRQPCLREARAENPQIGLDVTDRNDDRRRSHDELIRLPSAMITMTMIRPKKMMRLRRTRFSNRSGRIPSKLPAAR